MDSQRQNGNRTARLGVGFVVAATLVLGACSASDQATMGDVDTAGTDGGGEAAGATTTTTGPGDEVAGQAFGSSGEDGSDGSALLTSLGQDTSAGRSIVRRVSIGIEVEDPTAAVDAITAAARQAGGFVAEADLHRVESTRPGGLLQGSMTLRIPVDRLDATLVTLRELSTSVPETSITTEDVTAQLVDLEARLTNLRALEAELRSFLAEARDAPGATPDAVLTVFDRLNQVRSDIERLEAQRSNLGDLVALATLRVDLRAAASAATVVPDGWNATGVVRSAAHATLVTLQAVANVAIWVVAFALPVGLVVGLPVAAGWWAVRRRRTGATTA